MTEAPICSHRTRKDGVCTDCGHCEHDMILNGACFYCGSTNIDPVAISPKPPALIAAERLTRNKQP